MLIAPFVVAAALGAAAPAPAPVIEVSDVEQLYDAVNEPANAGATIVLAPGQYVLTRIKPGDGPRPNGGRLELQTDMSITGVSGHPEDVVIDSSNPGTGPAFALGGNLGNGGTIRIGRGRNNTTYEYTPGFFLLNARQIMTAKIFNGANPADLPIQLPDRFNLTVNLRVVGQLKLQLPTVFLGRVDEVIE